MFLSIDPIRRGSGSPSIARSSIERLMENEEMRECREWWVIWIAEVAEEGDEDKRDSAVEVFS